MLASAWLLLKHSKLFKKIVSDGFSSNNCTMSNKLCDMYFSVDMLILFNILLQKTWHLLLFNMWAKILCKPAFKNLHPLSLWLLLMFSWWEVSLLQRYHWFQIAKLNHRSLYSHLRVLWDLLSSECSLSQWMQWVLQFNFMYFLLQRLSSQLEHALLRYMLIKVLSWLLHSKMPPLSLWLSNMRPQWRMHFMQWKHRFQSPGELNQEMCSSS